ncbi:MAG: rhomboid family intramembrane serine protease [Spirochaetes bacterium]|nr:rhomboid family intramembrane serine protease [Spirochaetota bacterium]
MKTKSSTFYKGWAFRLIIINVIIFILQVFTEHYRVSQQGPSLMTYYLGLIPALVVKKGFIWQVFSYMFLHSSFSFSHIFFNMYALLIFGLPIENEWGSKKFLIYYLFCGTFAGISIFLINLINQGAGFVIPTIGASGAVFGLLLAFGILFPNVELLLFFILPIKAKYLVILYGGLELFLLLTGGNTSVSHIGHLGGLVAGLIYFFIIKRRSLQFRHKLNQAARRRKINIAGREADRQVEQSETDDAEYLIRILKKVKDSGIESLTDDDFQYIKYIEIMAGDVDEDTLCNSFDFDINDDHCRNCDDFKACFLREIKKYL